MKNKKTYMAILLGLLVGTGSTVCADSMIVGSIADSMLLTWDGAANFGSEALMYLRRDVNGTAAPIAKFDVPVTGPGQIQINYARMAFWADEYNFAPGASFEDIALLQVGSAWDESTVSWNTQPAISGLLGTTGAYDDGTDIIEGDAKAGGWLFFDSPGVASAVQGWVDGTVANDGVVVYGNADNATEMYMLLFSREHPNAGIGMDPYLYVDYSVIPEPATFGLLGVFGAMMLVVRRKFGK